jgi:phosphatidate cytidylyltransferase
VGFDVVSGGVVPATPAMRGNAAVPDHMLKRAVSAAVLLPLFVLVLVVAPPAIFVALVVAVSAAAAWELGRMFERAGRPAYPGLCVAAGFLVTLSFAVPGASVIVLTAVMMLVMSVPVWVDAPLSLEPAAAALLAAEYVGWPLGHAVLLHELAAGAWLILFLVGVTWAGESAAYLVGSSLGRHRLAPVISPAKTMEGAGAQLVVSVIAALLLGAWLLPAWPASFAAGAGAFLGVIGQLGDLAESVVKRSLGTKDTGALIPGHGGVLDRIDSLLFNVPSFYYYVKLWGGTS